MPHDVDDQDAVEAEDSQRPAGLTRNETMVWHVLWRSDSPLKAYEVLDRLKARGVRAPMTVYRALDGLVGKGLVHKLDALNAFMICTHDHPHDVQAFLLCDNEECSSVTEFEIDNASVGVQVVLRSTGFAMTSARLEVHGLCKKCADAAAAKI